MSNAPVSSRVLEAAIAWKLNLDGGSDSPAERGEFMRWHAASEEHARAWRQLGAMDQRLSAAAGPARQALLQSRASLRRRIGKVGGGLAGMFLLGSLLAW
ncbi:amino acid ABC transporter substrate-binding protein, partial [Pseudomonas sp. TJI-51]